MGERLLSPPLIEALCEFRFKPTGPWDWTLPGRLYDQIGKEFTERSQVDVMEVSQIHSEPGKLPLPIVKRFQVKNPVLPHRALKTKANFKYPYGKRNPFLPVLPHGVSRVSFMKRSDGSAMVQTGPDLLALNCMRLYPGWEKVSFE